MDNYVHLTFTAQQMDYIAQVLASRPYAEVAKLIADIQMQIRISQQNTKDDIRSNGSASMEVS